jgi:predicted transcriptional regulator
VESDSLDVHAMNSNETVEIAADIVVAYISANRLPVAELPALIKSIFGALTQVASGVPSKAEEKKPAVTVKKSITPNYLICLEDGGKFQSLKRHLAILGLTPEAYRAKWRLPKDYPMVAPNYAARRQAIARDMKLGLTPHTRSNASTKTPTA